MALEEFEAAADEAKRMEKKQLGYSPYEAEVEIVHTLDLEPREYVDLGYRDMLNLYERTQKIRSAAGLGILTKEAAAEAPPAPQPSARSEEVESKLRAMTTQTLEKAEELGKEEIEFEREAPPQPEEKPAETRMEIEFEHMPAEKPLEFEKEKPVGPEMEKAAPETKPEAMREAKPAEIIPEAERKPGAPAPPERRVVVAALPLSLRESPDEAAAKRYGQIEEQIRSALGGATDEVTLKKKMLDLTKELFKEKSTSRRERIKLEITVLRDMLSSGVGAARKRKKGPEAEEKETHSRVLETILSSQQTELAQTKDSVIGSYTRQTATVKKRFHDDLAAAGEDTARKKQALETLVFSLTSLVEQLPGVFGKYEDFLSKKHAAEIDKLRGSLGDKEKDVDARARERLEHIREGYKAEFATIKSIVAHDIDNLIEASGRGVFGKAEGEKEDEESRARDVIIEINETDEGTLLYYLHSKQPDYYRRYERKQISKAEAIYRAKAIMAKEKGLSDEMISRHFAATEG